MAYEENSAVRWKKWAEGLPLMPLFILVAFVAAVYAVGDAVLAPKLIPRQPEIIDVVLGSRAVVASLRVAIIFAGVSSWPQSLR
jgi:hypothetical protein